MRREESKTAKITARNISKDKSSGGEAMKVKQGTTSGVSKHNSVEN
jgi:hypothetical protein